MRALIFLILTISLIVAKPTIIKLDGAKTYPVKEKNIIKLIKDYVKTHKKELIAKLNKEKEKAYKRLLKSYKPKNLTINVPPAKQDRVEYFDPTYTLEFDIKDATGKIIYPKGFKFNPLHYVTLKKRYVFFNANRKDEIKWIKKYKLNRDLSNMLMITDGNVFKVMKDLNTSIFFASDKILERFHITQTPSIAMQDGDRIKILIYGVKDDK